MISIKNYLFFKKKKKARSTRSFQNQNRYIDRIILSFKKAVVYILSTKKKMILGNGAKWNLREL